MDENLANALGIPADFWDVDDNRHQGLARVMIRQYERQVAGCQNMMKGFFDDFIKEKKADMKWDKYVKRMING